jgi:cytosine/adenosine deaminase-related metal-dependent hydrolase
MIVYLARRLLPVASPPVAEGAVALHESKIALVGRRKDVLKAAGAGAEVRDLGDAVILPGFVNVHTHVELSWMTDDPPPGGSYMGWLEELVERRKREDPGKAVEAAEKAVAAMVARGTVAVGDVGNGTWVASVLARSPLRAVVFHEVYGFRASEAESVLEQAAGRLETIQSDPDVRAAAGRIELVLTPHAAHTTSAPLLKALAGRSAATAQPLSIHVAESEAELALLHDGSGPFAEFLKARGVWDDTWRAPGISPVEYLDRLGVLSPRTLAVHAVHLGQQDISKLQARQVTVVTCPRSNYYLDVGKTPVPRLLASGIPVALGTDSLASVADLDMLAEMAALRHEHPGLAPAAVLRMATLNGARALGLGKELGSIEPGKAASLAVVPLEDPQDDPLEVVTTYPEQAMPLDGATWEPVSS